MNILSAEEFRKKEAFLINPLKQVSEFELKGIEDEIVHFFSILPEVFGDDLDRLTLWDRISNGVLPSLSKSGDDFGVFINGMLEYIKASASKVAVNDNIVYFIQSAETKPKEWTEMFMEQCSKRLFLIIVKARIMWNQKKELQKKESKDK